MSFESPESDIRRSGKSHPTWEGSAIQPEAQAGWCREACSIHPSRRIFKSLRADLVFLRFRHLAYFCPLVSFLQPFKASLTPPVFSFVFLFLFSRFLFQFGFHGDLAIFLSLPSYILSSRHPQVGTQFRKMKRKMWCSVWCKFQPLVRSFAAFDWSWPAWGGVWRSPEWGRVYLPSFLRVFVFISAPYIFCWFILHNFILAY